MTRQGAAAIVAGAVSIAIGRMFGVIELFVIGAGFLGAFVTALAYVSVRTPARRRRPDWIHPSVLVAGDTGTVDLDLHHRGAIRSTRFELHERVRRANVGDHVADLTIEPLPADGRVDRELPAPDVGTRRDRARSAARRRSAIRSACSSACASSPEPTR